MKRVLALCGLLVALAAMARPVSAQGSISVTSIKFTNNFRTNLLFQVEAKSSAKISQIGLIVQLDGVASSSSVAPEFTPDTQVKATYTWDLGQKYLPPGVTGQYWWNIQDSSGGQLQTPKQSFRVDDNSQQWQKLSNDQLALYWSSGGSSFGQALFDKGVQSMDYLQKDTGVTVQRQIQIFVYGDRNAFFKALSPGSQEWTGGQAYPEYSIVLINIEPNNLEWGKGATTHELTHQVIHQVVKGPLGDFSLPHWMDEGLAVYYENPGQIDPQFSIPLKRAVQNDTLVTIRSLNSNFPADPTAANLAYGESWSVVDFIIRHYGKDKLAQILQQFKAGAYYDDVFTKVLGVDTDGLDNAWRQDIGAKPRQLPARAAGTATPFPTFSLSTDSTPVPTSAAPAATPTPPQAGAVATPTSLQVAVNATPATGATAVPPSGAASSPASPLTNVCGGVVGLIVFGLFGAGAWWRTR